MEYVDALEQAIIIALEFHFDSPEAFTRAFKKVYRISPVKYRKNRIEGILGNFYLSL